MRMFLVAGYAPSLVRFRGALIRSLRGVGVEVHAAAPCKDLDHSDAEALADMGVVLHDVPIRRVGLNPLQDARTFICLYRLFRGVKPDIVLSYTVKAVVYGTLSAWLARVPKRFCLITGVGYAFVRTESSRRLVIQRVVSLLYKLALGRSHKVFFQNRDDQELFRERKLVAPRLATAVINGSGVDITEFQSVPVVIAPFRFLMIARFLGDKGVREYVEAARGVRRVYGNVVFCLAGWIDENPNSITSEELDRWIAEGVIEHLGKLADVRHAIAASSVYVLPSYREGVPRTVLEAMAMGRPIITTDAPGCRDTVIDGENGFLVPVCNPEKLAEAMTKFIKNPSLIEKMGRKSRGLAEEKYDVHKVNAVMLKEMEIK